MNSEDIESGVLVRVVILGGTDLPGFSTNGGPPETTKLLLVQTVAIPRQWKTSSNNDFSMQYFLSPENSTVKVFRWVSVWSGDVKMFQSSPSPLKE